QHPHSEESEQISQCILTEKYTPRYQLMLWMSAGLLYQQGKKTKQFSPLLRFWCAILSQPRDMIGFHHNVLVMHCLDECEADDCVTLHKKLITQQWIWFQSYTKRAQNLRILNQYPEQLARCSILLASSLMLGRLLENLKDNDRSMKRAVIQVLGNLNNPTEDVIELLLNALSDEDSDVREAAIIASGELNNPSEDVVQALLFTLGDDVREVHYAAADILCQLKNPSDAVVNRLLDALEKKPCWEREMVARALGDLNNPSEAVIQALLKVMDKAPFLLLQGEEPEIKQAIAEALYKLSKLSKTVFQTLLNILQDQDEKWQVRQVAAIALGKLSNPSDVAIYALRCALRDQSYHVRAAAAQALGKLNNQNHAVTEALLWSVLMDEDPIARQSAVEALGNLKNLSVVVVQTLLDVLQDERVNMRQSAIKALAKLENPNAVVIQALLEALQDGKQAVRQDSVEALGKLNNPTVAVIQALLDASQEEGRVGKAAVEVLGNLNNPSVVVVQTLLDALQDKKLNVRQTVIQVLGKLNNPSEAVIKALLSVSVDKNEYVKQAAIEALGNLNNPSETVIKALLSALVDKNEYVKRTAIQALGKVKNPSKAVLKALLTALKDESDGLKQAVIEALVNLNNLDTDVIKALLDNLKDEHGKEWLKESIVRALGRLSDSSKVVIEVLLNALRDKNENVRRIAVHALSIPKTAQAMTIIFELLVDDDQLSFEYFSLYFKQHYLLCVDHSHGQVIARLGRQIYHIHLPSKSLVYLEKQIIAASGHDDGNYTDEKKAVLQACGQGAPICCVSDAIWAVHLVRKKASQRTLLMVESMAAGKHIVQCYEFVLSQRSSNPASGFFPPGSGIGRVVKIENFLDVLEKDKHNYQCKSWDVEPTIGQKLLQLLEAEALSSEAQRHDCLAWAQEKLEAIDLVVEKGRWADFTVALPEVALEKSEKPAQAEKNGCQLM
ncbi:MAG: hypothetical protein K0Q74_951, partial [Gammaproteobacteria bacterium]|nr:hypothetical protein [Gammaproteobacteria bacterium]